MKKITIREIIKATGAQMIALGDMEEALNKEIWYVTQDSRETKEGVLFVARVGEVRDGHDFLPQCFANGVTACLSQKVVAPTNGAIVLLVPDTGKALLDLAAYYRNLFDIPVVAVTGSVGKTTTKDMIASVVSQKYDTVWTQGNYNNEVGVPLTIFRIEEHHQAAIIEMGMNHFGEISRLTRAVAPTVGLITNIGVSHIENLGSRAGILQAKLEILEGMAPDAPLIVNMDNDMLRTVKLGDRPLLTFAIDDQSADFTATDIAEQGSTTTFTVHHSTFTQPVTIPTVGIHNVYNALAAMAVGYVTGVNLAAAAAALANYVPAGMRQNLVQVGGVQVIEDCYNASPDSMRAALQTLGKLPVHRRYAVLGAMLELGDYAKEAHTQVGKMAAENGIDGVLAYGADAAYIVEAAKQAGLENARLFDTKEALAQSLALQVQPGDGVLFKGSRGMHLEDVMHTVYERWEKA